MPILSRFHRPVLHATVLAAAVLLPALWARADTIYVRSGHSAKAAAVAFKGRVDKIAKTGDVDELYWISEESGRSIHRPLQQVARIEVDGDPVFNAAEQAFAQGDLKSASDNYRRAMAAATSDWEKHRCDVRLLSISSKIGDFSGAVAGFVQMAAKDPAAAQQQRPNVDQAKPDQVTAAISAVNSGLTNASPRTQQVLLPFLADLYNKKGDSAGASKALAEYQKLQPPGARNAQAMDNSSTGAPSAAATAAKQAEADLALNEATAAMNAHQYSKVISAINSHADAFIDPDRQEKALYMLAQAKEASASTPQALEDAALAYMRVVAHFKSQPNSPAAESLFKTGAIEEKLSKPRQAILVYTQVVNEYKGSPAALQAQAAIDRIRSKQ